MSARHIKIHFKEARLNLEPISPSSTIQVQVSSHSRSSPLGLLRGASGASATAGGNTGGGKHDAGFSGPIGEEERAFRSQNLATASGIYQRRHHSSPRCFLWRLLENDTVVSLRVADVCKHGAGGIHGALSSSQSKKDSTSTTAAEYPLILHLRFPHPVHPLCLGFSDPRDHDALCMFSVDTAGQLYSVALRPDAFRRKLATEGGVLDGGACKVWSPPAFGFRHPHRLVPVNPDQLIVTMHDGGILRFDKNRSHDATEATLWKETIYNVAGWGQSLRGLVPFQRTQTVRYDKINMELTAAASTAVASMSNGDTPFLFTICLDHRMRVWDVRSGQILYTGDMLNTSRDPHDIGKWIIDPSQHNLIRIIEQGHGQCLAVTFSPVGSGEFKFWKVKSNDQGSIHVADMFAGEKLEPPNPSSSDVWTMADFALADRAEGPELWTLWKNNMSYRVQKLQVHLDGGFAGAGCFGGTWQGVFIDSNAPPVPASSACDPVDSTEKWLDLIFYPGRFSKSTLEAARSMYERGLGTKEPHTRNGRSISESICNVLGSTTALDRNATGGMDYDQFRSASETQWMRFWRLLLELDKQRGEALSLVLDSETGMVWIACADYVAAVRQCSKLDHVYHNLQAPEAKHEAVSALVAAGLAFVDSFTDSMVQQSKAALLAELYDDASKSHDERIQQFFDKAGFWRQVTDEDCAQVLETLGDNFQGVTSRLYDDLFELILASAEANSQALLQEFTGFGQKVVVRAVQETVELHWQVLFSQLILLAHMEFEIEEEDQTLHSRLDIGSVYQRLVLALRRLEQVRWLAKTELNTPASRVERSYSGVGLNGLSPATAKHSGGSMGPEDGHALSTALESLTGHLLGLPEGSSLPLTESITDAVLDFCAPDSATVLDTWLLQCWLLKQGRPDLAFELGPFAAATSQDPFSTYVQGRVSLALRDFETAATYFRQASVGLSMSPDTNSSGIRKKRSDRHSAGLLDDTEWNLLYNGLASYYLHVVNLHDRVKAYVFVMEFAQLSLQFVESGDVHLPNSQESTLAPSQSSSAMLPSAASAPRLLRTEILSRLFAAATATSHFDTAHAALVALGGAGQDGDEALQRSYLRKLVERMCEAGQTAELVSQLPFSGALMAQVDELLAEKCRAADTPVVQAPAPAPQQQQQQLQFRDAYKPLYHQILYAWRVARGDYRGAAAVLLNRLRKMRTAGAGGHGRHGGSFGADHGILGEEGELDKEERDALDTAVTRQYLLLINALSCVAPGKDAWILEDVPAEEIELAHRANGDGHDVNGNSNGGEEDLESTMDDLLRAVESDASPHGPQPGQQTVAGGLGDRVHATGGPEDAALMERMKKFSTTKRRRQQQQQEQNKGWTLSPSSIKAPKRRLLTLADLRKHYQQELDRIVAIQNNRFGLLDGEDNRQDDGIKVGDGLDEIGGELAGLAVCGEGTEGMDLS